VLNLLNLSVPPNVLLLVPAAAVVVVPPPVLDLELFAFLLPVPAAVVFVVPPPVVVEPFAFLLPVVFFVVVALFFFTANVEAVILPAVTSAIAVTITNMLIVLFLYADWASILHSYYRFYLVVDWTDEFYKPYIQY